MQKLFAKALEGSFATSDERTRARAGGIEQNAIKREEFIKLARIDTHDLYVLGALLFKVVLELVCSGSVHLRGCHMGLRLEGRELRGFAAGCRAHVQDVLTGLRGQCQWGQHGREALQVDFSIVDKIEIPNGSLKRSGDDKGIGVPRRALELDACGAQCIGNFLRI